MTEWLDIRYAEYSTGIRRRLGLMRALFTNPRLLLLDEPERSLDEASRILLLQRVQEQMTRTATCVVLATHQPDTTGWPAHIRYQLADGTLKESP